MPGDEEANERTKLLDPRVAELQGHRRSIAGDGAHHLTVDETQDSGIRARSILSSHVSKEEQALGGSAVGERLPYNDYTTIDWLHDLASRPNHQLRLLRQANISQVKDSFRHREIHSKRGLKAQFWSAWDRCQGWVAAAMIGCLTAVVAFIVDIATSTISDYKQGYCSPHPFRTREACCSSKIPQTFGIPLEEECSDWIPWSGSYWPSFLIYVGFALAFGLASATVTLTTRSNLPSVSSEVDTDGGDLGNPTARKAQAGKSMLMAAGSGIPEIKTILSGFVIPGFLSWKVLVVKGIGATFAVSTGMCLGKEGPFVHIATCAGWIVASLFPKYKENGRKMREMLSVACSAGLSVAFGAPIGGVLFSYEEISTYFPRKVLWRAFLCSLTASVVLRALDPTGTGKLILFETSYGTNYKPVHYLIFVLLGVLGGFFGGIFCKANFLWSKSFRKLPWIAKSSVFEVFLVVLVTACLQYPNPLTREPGDIIIRNLLQDCKNPGGSWVCEQETLEDKSMYYGWLIYGALVKLGLTIVTFGCKVPSGVIIPALDAGALVGRLIGQFVDGISPGIFAMVGAAAFLAGVSRMTVSLTVIMFELTGEVDYIPPFMIAILVAKWVADAISSESVYDLAQTVLGHPFLDPDHAVSIVRDEDALVEELIPPEQTMREITVDVGPECKVSKQLLASKLAQLKARGLMDAGLVLVDPKGFLHGYLAEGELDFAIHEPGVLNDDEHVDLLEGVLSTFVDRTPLTIAAKAPMEYAVEMFGKLGLRHLIVVNDSGKVVGVIIKKRLVLYLEGLQKHG